MKRRLLLLSTGMFAVAATTGTLFSAQPAQAESLLNEIQERGKLIAGVRFDYPPNGYVDATGGNIGFAPDIARELAKRLGVEVEFVQTTSKTRIPMLLNGSIDADIGPTTPSKSRDEVVDFTYTYAWDRVVIVTQKGKSTDPADYYNGPATIGATQGSIFVKQWQESSPDADIKLYQEYPELVVALSQGTVDVGLFNEFTANDLIEKMGPRAENLQVGQAFIQDPQAIGVRENDSNYRDWINWALQRMWDDGTFQTIYKAHYKSDPPFHLWENGQLQPGVMGVGKEDDPWNN